MKDKKIWLYLLFGMLAFALWDAWQRDHRSVEKSPSNVQTEKTTSIIPVVPKNVVTEDKRLLQIHTDLLDLTVDLRGGAIVGSSLKQYTVSLKNEDPVRLLNEEAESFYVARSGLVGVNPNGQVEEPINFEVAAKEYWLEGEDLTVELTGHNDQGIAFTRLMVFRKGQHDFKVVDRLTNNSGRVWQGVFYAEIERKKTLNKKGLFNFSTYAGAAISSKDKPYEKVSYATIDSCVQKKQGKLKETQGGWLAMQQRYFLNVWIPDSQLNYQYLGKVNGDLYAIGLRSELLNIPAETCYEQSSVFYTGPELAKNTGPLAKGLDRTADYGWLWVISIGLLKLLRGCYRVLGNWGLAIIIVTLLIKLVFYKFSESSYRSMAKMKTLMPKMEAIKQRYAHDQRQLQEAMMNMYKQEKVNPLNFGGCLPMLIQIPFFIALYYVLIGAVELRQAPFYGWIQDLSVQDPYYILPILMGLTMFLQQKMSPATADPAQAKVMLFMPILFTFLFVKFPAGLVLYWVVNNLLSILQQWLINRRLAQGEVNRPRKT